MKQTAVEKMIQYFIEQKDNGASHWCINDLIAQLYQAKAMEKEQIFKVYFHGWSNGIQGNFISQEEYYIENFKSE